MEVITSGFRVNKSVSGIRLLGESALGAYVADKPTKFKSLKVLADVAKSHSWTSATLDTIARSVIGPGWTLVRDERYGEEATEEQRTELVNFFEGLDTGFNNINDFASETGKLYQTIVAYRLFGQVAWEILYDNRGRPIGFDVLSGYVEPNVSENGDFLDPAFRFYPWDGGDVVEFPLEKIVYMYNPGITGEITGESIYSALASTSIPADIYASVTFRELFANINSPYNGIWVVDETVSDEDFDFFVSLLEERYSGAENFGRNPLVVRGNAEFKELQSRSREDAPYLEGRRFSRQEISAVTGVSGIKMGIVNEANKSNMREARREFHEAVLKPLFNSLESQIYKQVIVRVFGYRGWRFRFNAPDFTTALEDATIHMRYLQNGVLSPNEVRDLLGRGPREGGDVYIMPSNAVFSGDSVPATEPNTGPIEPAQPPRDEAYPDSESILKELKLWRKHVLRAMDGKCEPRPFQRKHIPPAFYVKVQEMLDQLDDDDFDGVKKVFDTARRAIELWEP